MGNRKVVWKLVSILATINLFFCSCGEEKRYFKGDVVTIDTFDKEMTLKGTKVDLRDIYEGRPFVCDSFLIFNSFQCPDYYFYAFDLRSGKHVASFCPKGDGPEDYLSCDESAQLIKENGDNKIWVRDYNKQKIHLINITQSIIQQKTICDSIIPFEWTKHFAYPLLSVFFLDDGSMLGINQCEESPATSGNGYTLRDLYLFKESFDNKIREYHLYQSPVISLDDKVKFECFEFYNAVYRIRPNCTQLAIAMKMLAQVSVVDIETGEQRNYRMKESLTYPDIEKDIYKSRRYYETMAVNDQYIFALYVDAVMKDVPPPYSSHVIHVLTWNGEPAYKIHVDESIRYITLDTFGDTLYAIDVADNLYSYDISRL